MNGIIKRGVRVNGPPLPPVTPVAEVAGELAELARIYGGCHDSDWKAKALARIASLQTATTRLAGPGDFGVVLWSVGNPDHGQFHGPGAGSPGDQVAVA